MKIRKTAESDKERLLEIWLRSVRVSHTFLSESDIQSILPQVRDIAFQQLDLWTLTTHEHKIIGFMGLHKNKMEALFLDPDYFRQGGGRFMVEYAISELGIEYVDVNAQNPDARKFYASLGFIVYKRSELDSEGRPFPILHMHLANAEQSAAVDAELNSPRR